MIIPSRAKNFEEVMQWSVEIYHNLKKILSSNNHSIAVGDEKKNNTLRIDRDIDRQKETKRQRNCQEKLETTTRDINKNTLTVKQRDREIER